MSEAAELYVLAAGYLAAAAIEVDPDERIPACPAWDVHDLVAHQEHQLASVCTGVFPARDSLESMTGADHPARANARRRQDEWIAAGLAQRRSMPVAELLATWNSTVAAAPSRALEALLPDVAVHLFDLLGACGSRSHRDHTLVAAALLRWHAWSEHRLEQINRGPLRLDIIHGATRRESIGAHEADVIVSATAFELLRAITGRRSLRQAQILDWVSANDDVVERFSVYGWRHNDLEE
jgi:hypothetical protein